MASNVETVSLPDISDGDAAQWPTGPEYKRVDPPLLYLQKLGQLWMKHNAPEKIKPGVTYYLDGLPRGYAVYEKARPSDTDHVARLDRFVYGYPSTSSKPRYTSPNEFWPHLNHLQLHQGTSANCPCRLCGGSPRRSTRSSTPARAETPAIVLSETTVKRKPGRPPKAAANLSQRHDGEISKYFDSATSLPDNQALPEPSYGSNKSYVDEEGTPIALQVLFKRLQKQGTLDIEITEPLSIDWCALQAPLHTWIDKTTKQSSWIPRQGEIVLVVTRLPPNTDIEFRAETQAFELYNTVENRWSGLPCWQAAVIGQEPIEAVDLTDITDQSRKNLGPVDSGWRIELLPEANQPNKSLTTRYKYVSTKYIRPFALRREILQNIPSTQWDPTIWNAMLIQSSVVVVGHHRLTGKWPKATVFCTGIYLGSEFVAVGDTVSVRPSLGETAPTVLEIHAIKLEYPNLGTDDVTHDIMLEGKAFTTDPRKRVAKSVQRPPPSPVQDYDTSMYLRHEEHQNLKIPFNRVLGRCPEAKAMHLWFPVGGSPSLLNMMADSILEAREYSSKRDVRILPGKKWLWANTRLSALDVPSLNGVPASHSDPLRNERVEEGQQAARVLSRPSAKNQAAMRQVVERPKASIAAGAMGMMRTAPAESGQEQDDLQMESEDERVGTPQLQVADYEHNDPGIDPQDRPEDNEDTIVVVSPSRKRSASSSVNAMDDIVATEAPESQDSSDEFADAPMLLETFQANKKPKTVADG